MRFLTKKRVFISLLGLVIALLGFSAGFGTNWLLLHLRSVDAAPTGDTETFDLFWETWHILQRDFYGPLPDQKQMTYSAIRGVLSSLNDPYTSFVEPEPRELERHDLEGRFGGIGAWVLQEGAGTFVLSPMRNRPAAQAGILEGDVLVTVDGVEITSETSIEDVLSLVRGPVGSTVEITVRRERVDEILSFQVTRQEIEIPSVSWEVLEDNPTIGYARLNLFSERTADELQEALNDLTAQGAEQFVLDLRDNGGGLLQAAIDVSSLFIPDGVILYEERRGGEEKFYPAEPSDLVIDAPLVVLINGGTASASEIVAGAVQDRGRGILVGESTFGKGSVQLIYDLSDGSSLHVTAARWLTPDRHQIDGAGLTPDIQAELTPQDREQGRDPQLDKAVQLLEREKVHSFPSP